RSGGRAACPRRAVWPTHPDAATTPLKDGGQVAAATAVFGRAHFRRDGPGAVSAAPHHQGWLWYARVSTSSLSADLLPRREDPPPGGSCCLLGRNSRRTN